MENEFVVAIFPKPEGPGCWSFHEDGSGTLTLKWIVTKKVS